MKKPEVLDIKTNYAGHVNFIQDQANYILD